MIPPSLGRIVHYTLTDGDAQAVNRRRAATSRWAETTGEQLHVGSRVSPGDVFPAMVVQAGEPTNLQVFLDGNDVLWVERVEPSRTTPEDATLGTWSWPTRAA